MAGRGDRHAEPAGRDLPQGLRASARAPTPLRCGDDRIAKRDLRGPPTDEEQGLGPAPKDRERGIRPGEVHPPEGGPKDNRLGDPRLRDARRRAEAEEVS